MGLKRHESFSPSTQSDNKNDEKRRRLQRTVSSPTLKIDQENDNDDQIPKEQQHQNVTRLKREKSDVTRSQKVERKLKLFNKLKRYINFIENYLLINRITCVIDVYNLIF